MIKRAFGRVGEFWEIFPSVTLSAATVEERRKDMLIELYGDFQELKNYFNEIKEVQQLKTLRDFKTD